MFLVVISVSFKDDDFLAMWCNNPLTVGFLWFKPRPQQTLYLLSVLGVQPGYYTVN